MDSTERVRRTILGEPTDRQPIYGWVGANFPERIAAEYGSVENFEDKYEFDAAHLFGGPGSLDEDAINAVRAAGEELTPEVLLDIPFKPVDRMEDYEGVKKALAFHKQRGRFCYVQTPGFFEHFNGAFGIEDHLCYLALYNDEVKELYRRQCQWTKRFASNMMDLGVDMVHISDDWGAQNSLMFSPKMWWDMIYPNMKELVDHIHARGVFASLHSDGCIRQVADGRILRFPEAKHEIYRCCDTTLERYWKAVLSFLAEE